MRDKPRFELNRRSILKQLGTTAGAAAVGLPSIASASSNIDDASRSPNIDNLPSADQLDNYSIEEASIQSAVNKTHNLIAFTTVTADENVSLYIARGVTSTSDEAKNVERVASGVVIQPTWVDDSTLSYWKEGTVFEREVTNQGLESAVASDQTLRSLMNSGVTTLGFNFNQCFSLPFVKEKICLSSSQFVKTRRNCNCGVCSGRQTPFMATVSFSVEVLNVGNSTISAGGWIGVQGVSNGFCYWSGDESSRTCGYTCLSAKAIPTPADLRDAFSPYLREIGVNPNGIIGTIILIGFIALIGATPLPGPA